jgi:uncharacterized protein
MIQQKIQSDQIAALKAGQSQTVTTLRYILAQIKNKEIEKKTQLTDEEAIQIIRKIAKELKESIEAFTKGARQDLVSEYQKQLDIVQPYLPKEMSVEDLKKEIQTIIDSNKEIIEKNPKIAIGLCMKALRAKADSSQIMTILKTLGF